jgi:hypothetical protein
MKLVERRAATHKLRLQIVESSSDFEPVAMVTAADAML